jgi:hypothetical protein
MKPSTFLWEFAAHGAGDFTEIETMDSKPGGSSQNTVQVSLLIEQLQLEFLEKKYREKNNLHVLPALGDIVRYHGALGRALVEGVTTEVGFTYNPEEVLEAFDLEEFAAFAKKRPGKIAIGPDS